MNHLLVWLDETAFASIAKKSPSFATYLRKYRSQKQSAPLSITSQRKILQITKQFLHWMKVSYPQQYMKLSPIWIDSLQVMNGSREPKPHEFVSLDESIALATGQLPKDLIVYQRDQAAAAMLFLSGMRASAFASLPIEAVNIKARQVKQWPSLGVRTKFSKHATTFLLNIPELLNVVEKWDIFVRSELPDHALWYPVIVSEWKSEKLSSAKPGKHRNIQLAKRLRKLSELLEIEYKSPHKFRHGHAVYALLQAKDMADYKAISQNLMHGDIRITDSVYAWLNDHQIKERIIGLSAKKALPHPDNLQMKAFLSQLSTEELKQAISTSLDMLTAS